MPGFKDGGWRQTRPGHYGPIDTPNGFKVRNEALMLWCPSGPRRVCSRNEEMDMDAMIARGWGDLPVSVIVERMRCSSCGRLSPAMSRNGRPRDAPVDQGGYASFRPARRLPAG